MQLPVSARLIDVGVDYVTAVAVDSKTATILSAPVQTWLTGQKKAGNIVKPWGMAGYSGWSCGQCQWGERHDGVIVRLSGDLADREWFECYQRCDHLTRLDVQATVHVGPTVNATLTKQTKAALRYSKKRQDKLKVDIWKGNDGGYTLYLGSRESSLFGRCYNKAVESKLSCWDGCARYEVEAKGGLANACANVLCGTGTVADGCLSIVSKFLAERGVPWWPELDRPKPIIGLHRNRTDRDRVLRWFTESVKPSVERLIEAGDLDEVLSTLGIEPYVAKLYVGHRPSGPISKDERVN